MAKVQDHLIWKDLCESPKKGKQKTERITYGNSVNSPSKSELKLR